MIIHGDCLDKMREMESNSIDFIVCDPPYGINFMGKKWDEKIPHIEIWKESLRVCKPGSMLAAFGGSRTHHHLMTILELVGWEIRDVIMWIYGSGFPKSHNFGKKLGGIWQGYGTALKPAYEPIIICQKPLHGTFAENAEKWGVAGINIEQSRIHGKPRTTHSDGNHKGCDKDGNIYNIGYKAGHFSNCPIGRWPSNLILDEESSEILDEMTGILKSGSIVPGHKTKGNSQIGTFKIHSRDNQYFKGDSGGASRFFYCAKTSSKERNRGLQGMSLKECGIKNDSGRGFSESDPYKKVMYKNNHPTVKPLSLMKYIVKLLAPPGDPICLDPFAGSGTTLIAAKELGIRAIGIEIEKEYCEIAEKRISAL